MFAQYKFGSSPLQQFLFTLCMGMFKHFIKLSIFSRHMMWSGDVQLEQSAAGTRKCVRLCDDMVIKWRLIIKIIHICKLNHVCNWWEGRIPGANEREKGCEKWGVQCMRNKELQEWKLWMDGLWLGSHGRESTIFDTEILLALFDIMSKFGSGVEAWGGFGTKTL